MRQRLNIGTNEATEKNNSGQNLLRQTAGSLNGRQFAFPLSAGTVNAPSARVPSIYYTEDFVRKLNTNIERYKTALKRRQGRKAGDKGETATESENVTDSEQ